MKFLNEKIILVNLDLISDPIGPCPQGVPS